jgi:hypothetical protein
VAAAAGTVEVVEDTQGHTIMEEMVVLGTSLMVQT